MLKDEKIIQIVNDLNWNNRFILLTDQGNVYDLKIKRKIGEIGDKNLDDGDILNIKLIKIEINQPSV